MSDHDGTVGTHQSAMTSAEYTQLAHQLEDEAGALDRAAVRSTCEHWGRETWEFFQEKQRIDALRAAATRLRTVATLMGGR